MAIPYLLMGNIDEKGTWLRKDPAHFARLRIALKEGRAASLDAAARAVKLESGESLPSIGCSWRPARARTARRSPGSTFPACIRAGRSKTRAIAKRAKKGSRVLQMGAGFIGCIIMEALAERGVELVVVEMGERMVPRMMPPGASELIRAWCERRGIRVFTGAR